VPKKEDSGDDTIRKGIVNFFNDAKGYGFIKDLETKENIFVHINNTLDEIREGQMVTVEISKGQRGPSAVNVKKYIPEKQ